jgi:uncharacterized membrane protein
MLAVIKTSMFISRNALLSKNDSDVHVQFFLTYANVCFIMIKNNFFAYTFTYVFFQTEFTR